MIASWPPIGFGSKCNEEEITFDILVEKPTKIPILQTVPKTEDNRRNHALFKHLSNQITKIAPNIFESSPTALGTRCFLAITAGELSLIDALNENSLIQEFAITILNKDEFHLLSLIRLAGVTLASILNRPEKLSKSCGFIFQFLRYIDEQAIFDFFRALCRNKPELDIIQKFLIESNFEKVITEQIKMAEDDDPRLRYLFRIVVYSKKSPILQPHFSSNKVLSVLSGKTTEIYEDDRWEAILAVYSEATFESMRCIFQQAVEVLKDYYTECTRGRIAVLQLITEMIKSDPQIHLYVSSSNLASTMNRLIVQFPFHTFLLKAIKEFSEASFKSMLVSATFAVEFIPLCINMVKSEVIRPVVGVCYQILNAAKNEAEGSDSFFGLVSNIPGFVICANTLVKKYFEIIEKKYG